MAISNYSELKTALSNWLARTDLTDRYDEFIALCDARISYGGDAPYPSEPLRALGTEQANEDITISSQTTSLPTGFLNATSLYLNTSTKRDLDYFTPDRFWQTNAARSGNTGTPEIYTYQGTNLIVAPSPDVSYTGKITYNKKLTPLSDGNTTNWLITNAPHVYLYGSLLEAYIYDKDDQESAKMFALYKSAIDGLVDQDRTARHSGSSLSVRVDHNP